MLTNSITENYSRYWNWAIVRYTKIFIWPYYYLTVEIIS